MAGRRLSCQSLRWYCAGSDRGLARLTAVGAVKPAARVPALTRRAALVAPALAMATLARADAAVSLQLVLAVDASGSVDMHRFDLQKRGYAAAFRSRVVRAAIQSTMTGSIAVAMVQWTGPSMQMVVVDWTLLDTDSAILAFADTIDAAPRALFGGGTSVSGAIDFSAGLFAQSRFEAPRRVIDVSGDGANNRGRPAETARDEAVRAGLIVNGLPILALEPYLDVYYRDHVIGGPGAFMIPARSYDEFAQAIRAKLVTEIAGIPLPRRDHDHADLNGPDRRRTAHRRPVFEAG